MGSRIIWNWFCTMGARIRKGFWPFRLSWDHKPIKDLKDVKNKFLMFTHSFAKI